MMAFSRTEKGPFLRPELVVSWREIAGALLVLLAPFAVMSGRAASRGSRHHYIQAILSDRLMLLNGAAEAAILGLALVYFHWRAWKPADLRIQPTIRSTVGGGFVLFPLSMVSNGLVVFSMLLGLFFFQNHDTTFPQFVFANSPDIRHIHANQLSWVVLVPAMVLNSFLEEIICMAYAFNQFAAKLGPLFALVLTVALRMSCHTYQDMAHVLGVGAVFALFGVWYWFTRNLWPLIFAHAVMDTFSLGLLKLLTH